ncbi:hypothetical protein EYC80_001023 [Monilinia laxa]|uniref:Telomere replication protein EST3 n=1 Tax=Monilinia laxa TaxID=61186 RepID=A0A5N6K811_MONLA|nr:hypothetical protein EYC80_001023 [Monilinia laxa]
MRGWIAQHIELSLEEALVWLKSTHVGDKNVDKSDNRFSYDQRKLTIKLNKPGLIQLIGSSKVQNSSQFLTVSDGTTEIAAIFEQDFLKIGGTIDSTLAKIKDFLNLKDCNTDFHSAVQPGSRTSSPLAHSAKFATQISNRNPEPRKEKKAISDVQATDLLRILEQDRRPADQIRSNSRRPSKQGQLLESDNIASVAQLPSSTSSFAATSLERDNEVGNKKDVDSPQFPSRGSIDKQEDGGDGVLGNEKSSASNMRSNDIGSAAANRQQAGQFEEIYPFQENLTSIPRSYQHIPKDQADNLTRAESWFPSPENHDLTPSRFLEAQLEFHDKRLAAQASAPCKDLAQNTEGPILHQVQETTETEHEDFDGIHHGNDISKDSHKHAEDNESAYSQLAHNNDDGHWSVDDSRNGSQISWSTSPTREPNRHMIGTNDTFNQTLDQDQLIPQLTSPVVNEVGVPSPNGSIGPTSEPILKRTVGSPPSAVATESIRVSAVKIRVPLASAGNTPSSPSDDEELELDVPHALVDETTSRNSPKSEELRVPQPSLPAATRHKSAVQVEKTPSQRKRPHKYLSSDVFIPGTYTNSENKPEKGNLQTTSSEAFSLPPPPKLPAKIAENFDKALEIQHDLDNSKLHNPPDEPISSRSNDRIIHQSTLRGHTYSPLQIPNLDGAISDDQPSTSRSSSTDSSQIGQDSPEQGYNKACSAKRRKTTDPRALGFSQVEPPYRDSHELARDIRRRVLRSQKPRQDSRAAENSIKKDPQSLVLPEDLHMVENSIAKDVPNALSSTQIHQSEQHPTSLFEKYCKTYPRYNGSKKQFIQALVYLEWLGTPTRQPNRSLWDDFVRFYAHEYSDHVQTSATKMTGMQFYSHLGTFEPDFSHPKDLAGRIITPESVKAALSPESPDHDAVNDMREKYRGAARPASQQSTAAWSDQSKLIMQAPGERLNIVDTDYTLLSNDLQELEKVTPQKSLKTAGQLPSFSSKYFTPMKQKKRRTPPSLKEPLEWRSNSSNILETVAAPTRASEEPESIGPRRRFFETPSQLLLPPRTGSHHSFPSSQKPASLTNSPEKPDGTLSIQTKAAELATPTQKEATQPIMSEHKSPRERRPRRTLSKPLLEKSISPPLLRERSLTGSNKSEQVADWLENQEQPISVENSKKLPSAAPMFKGKWEFGKYLAQKRRESSNRRPRLTPRTSFSLKPRSSSGNRLPSPSFRDKKQLPSQPLLYYLSALVSNSLNRSITFLILAHRPFKVFSTYTYTYNLATLPITSILTIDF